MSHDMKCQVLAEGFLFDYSDADLAPELRQEHARKLAEAIQDVIEDYLADIDQKKSAR